MTEEEQLSRRARRAAEKTGAGEGGEPEAIKDRNARVRARAGGSKKQRERERAAAAAEGLGAAERVDDAIARSADATGRFVRNQFPWLQWVIVLGFAAVVALLIYNYRQGKDREKLGIRVARALDVATGRIASAEPLQPSDRNLVDSRPEFASEEARTAAALVEWKALSVVSSSDLAGWAELGRAATLFDAKKWGEARAVYQSVLAARALGAEAELRAREGVGLSFEAEGKLDDARGAFEKLKEVAGPAAKQLSRFHVARVRFLLGDKDAAREDLTKLRGELEKGQSLTAERGYLSLAVEELLKTIDPKAAAETGGISPEQLEQLKRQIEQMQKEGSTPGAPGAPPLELNFPAGPTP